MSSESDGTTVRIVQLLQTLEIGGLERLAIDLALRQKLEGHEPLLYCVVHAGPLADVAAAAGIPVHVFGKADGFSPRIIGQLAARLLKDRADVLHAHNALVLHYGITAAKLARVPVVVHTQHASNLDSDRRLSRLWTCMVSFTDAVVFVSQSSRDHFVVKNGISRHNTRVIYNGIDFEKFSSRVKSGVAPVCFRFGTVGRLQPVKDHVTLIQAFARVCNVIPGAELHILGDGPCRLAMEQAATSLGVANSVILHGANLDVAGFLSKLDLFVLSSLEEGLPIALMEAMATGLPIAATRLPSLTEIAPEGAVAWYCQPGSPQALGSLMLQMAQRQDLASIGAAARELARKFAIGESWRHYRKLFEELLDKKGCGVHLRAVRA